MRGPGRAGPEEPPAARAWGGSAARLGPARRSLAGRRQGRRAGSARHRAHRAGTIGSGAPHHRRHPLLLLSAREATASLPGRPRNRFQSSDPAPEPALTLPETRPARRSGAG